MGRGTVTHNKIYIYIEGILEYFIIWKSKMTIEWSVPTLCKMTIEWSVPTLDIEDITRYTYRRSISEFGRVDDDRMECSNLGT